MACAPVQVVSQAPSLKPGCLKDVVLTPQGCVRQGSDEDLQLSAKSLRGEKSAPVLHSRPSHPAPDAPDAPGLPAPRSWASRASLEGEYGQWQQQQHPGQKPGPAHGRLKNSRLSFDHSVLSTSLRRAQSVHHQHNQNNQHNQHQQQPLSQGQLHNQHVSFYIPDDDDDSDDSIEQLCGTTRPHQPSSGGYAPEGFERRRSGGLDSLTLARSNSVPARSAGAPRGSGSNIAIGQPARGRDGLGGLSSSSLTLAPTGWGGSPTPPKAPQLPSSGLSGRAVIGRRRSSGLVHIPDAPGALAPARDVQAGSPFDDAQVHAGGHGGPHHMGRTMSRRSIDLGWVQRSGDSPDSSHHHTPFSTIQPDIAESEEADLPARAQPSHIAHKRSGRRRTVDFLIDEESGVQGSGGSFVMPGPYGGPHGRRGTDAARQSADSFADIPGYAAHGSACAQGSRGNPSSFQRRPHPHQQDAFPSTDTMANSEVNRHASVPALPPLLSTRRSGHSSYAQTHDVMTLSSSEAHHRHSPAAGHFSGDALPVVWATPAGVLAAAQSSTTPFSYASDLTNGSTSSGSAGTDGGSGGGSGGGGGVKAFVRGFFSRKGTLSKGSNAAGQQRQQATPEQLLAGAGPMVVHAGAGGGTQGQGQGQLGGESDAQMLLNAAWGHRQVQDSPRAGRSGGHQGHLSHRRLSQRQTVSGGTGGFSELVRSRSIGSALPSGSSHGGAAGVVAGPGAGAVPHPGSANAGLGQLSGLQLDMRRARTEHGGGHDGITAGTGV